MSTNATGEQIEMLLDYMQEHQDLARGRLLRDVDGRVRAKQQWTELTTTLNGLGGSVKTAKQWQKVRFFYFVIMSFIYCEVHVSNYILGYLSHYEPSIILFITMPACHHTTHHYSTYKLIYNHHHHHRI